MLIKFLILCLLVSLISASYCPPTKRIGLGPLVKQGVPKRNILCPLEKKEIRPLLSTDPSSCGTLCWARKQSEGYRIRISGIVKSTDCKPVAGATVYLWATDNQGSYGNNYPDRYDEDCAGITETDKEGKYWFETDQPGTYGLAPYLPYDIPPWGPQHLHFVVHAPGYKLMSTQLFFPGDPARGHDPREILNGFELGSLSEEIEVTVNGNGNMRFVEFDFAIEQDPDPITKQFTFEQALLDKCKNISDISDIPIYPMLCYPDHWKKILIFGPPTVYLLLFVLIWLCYRRLCGTSKRQVKHKKE